MASNPWHGMAMCMCCRLLLIWKYFGFAPLYGDKWIDLAKKIYALVLTGWQVVHFCAGYSYLDGQHWQCLPRRSFFRLLFHKKYNNHLTTTTTAAAVFVVIYTRIVWISMVSVCGCEHSRPLLNLVWLLKHSKYLEIDYKSFFVNLMKFLILAANLNVWWKGYPHTFNHAICNNVLKLFSIDNLFRDKKNAIKNSW